MAGNWKMYKTAPKTRAFFQTFALLVTQSGHCEIVICPTFPNLAARPRPLREPALRSAPRTCTGPRRALHRRGLRPMLLAVGAKWVIVGHSERRAILRRDQPDRAETHVAALEYGLKPIVCVGEKLEERESGRTEALLAEQFREGIAQLSSEQFAKIVIAYEPVWAIGTGRTATPEIAADAHRFLRSLVASDYGQDAAAAVRILYGGSVKPDNVKILMAQPDIDGVLVGGASLDPAGFRLHRQLLARRDQAAEFVGLGGVAAREARRVRLQAFQAGAGGADHDRLVGGEEPALEQLPRRRHAGRALWRREDALLRGQLGARIQHFRAAHGQGHSAALLQRPGDQCFASRRGGCA